MGKVIYTVYVVMAICIAQIVIFIFMVCCATPKTSAIYLHIAIPYLGGWALAFTSQITIIVLNKDVNLLRRWRIRDGLIWIQEKRTS